MPHKHESSFAIRTASDFLYEMVVPQCEDFVANNASSRHALLAILLVHHMFDWAHGHEFSKARFLAEYPNDSKIADLFDLARNVSNGTKHFAPRAQTSAGIGYSSAYSHAYERPLNIEAPAEVRPQLHLSRYPAAGTRNVLEGPLPTGLAATS